MAGDLLLVLAETVVQGLKVSGIGPELIRVSGVV
jgi:hypothetical protein